MINQLVMNVTDFITDDYEKYSPELDDNGKQFLEFKRKENTIIKFHKKFLNGEQVKESVKFIDETGIKIEEFDKNGKCINYFEFKRNSDGSIETNDPQLMQAMENSKNLESFIEFDKDYMFNIFNLNTSLNPDLVQKYAEMGIDLKKYKGPFEMKFTEGKKMIKKDTKENIIKELREKIYEFDHTLGEDEIKRVITEENIFKSGKDGKGKQSKVAEWKQKEAIGIGIGKILKTQEEQIKRKEIGDILKKARDIAINESISSENPKSFTFYVGQNKYENSLMGSLFGSCFGKSRKGHMLGHVKDTTKNVIFVKDDETGDVIARLRTAVSTDGNIIGSDIYNKSDIDLSKRFAEFLQKYSNHTKMDVIVPLGKFYSNKGKIASKNIEEINLHKFKHYESEFYWDRIKNSIMSYIFRSKKELDVTNI